MKVLVTGVAGFIGSALANTLTAEGHEVLGVDSLTDYYDVAIKRDNLRKMNISRFIRADLNAMDLKELLRTVEVVYHQAGQPGVRKSWGKDFQIYTERNISATQKLLEAAKTAHLRRFVFASSSSVYGNAPTYPTTEATLPNPLSPYGVTKLAAEHLCNLYAENFGIPTTSLRYFTVYGPGQRPDMAFTRFSRAVLAKRPLTVYGTGEQVRDFTYVADIVRANILAGSSEAPAGRIYNVAGGTNISVNNILGLFRTISLNEVKVTRLEAVPGDVAITGGATDLIHHELGWAPQIGIEQGLTAQFRWAERTTEFAQLPAA